MVTEMIEKAIEIEGLLRIIRDGNPLPETYRMLKEKVAALAEEVNGLDDEEVRLEPVASPVDVVISTPAATEEMTEVVFSNEPVAQPADELDLTEEDDIILTFDDGLTASFEVEDTPSLELDATTETLMERIPMETPADETPAEKTVMDETPRVEAKPAVERIAMPKREKKLKSAFSLNDRFLYARELFGGDMKMFDSALDFIEGVDDYSVIEDYFFNEMEWDAEKPTVQAFMEIIRNKL